MSPEPEPTKTEDAKPEPKPEAELPDSELERIAGGAAWICPDPEPIRKAAR